ncbi:MULTISPECIES: ClpXP protease specificity-enhancing factor [unclassified Polaromonas]|uniref:ClpXP protease specificity-enhancing factor n=1 Tax=unclassified Polaromonas TaxID=2638319 RepID=UPI000F0812E0|nr:MULTISPECIES: ClpXP protease specificity-enhancing factor [unclassified Polaromonas]AYQ28403.1 ClpXP protease specificity-enhancing factor [Polaromonas sp. SP1]QGJ20476.1 ClpXP protease specificity-enhancing factor [Polaromonas sp. Pch-P]
MNALDSTSTRPYLIRALYEWCTDNGFTPYVAVSVDDTVQVPREYVKNNEIVLNISFDATSSLKLGNDFIEFKARFAGSAREIMVPISHVIAIYARENGQGMAFPMGTPASGTAPGADAGSDGGASAAGASASPSATPAHPHNPAEGPEGKIMQLVPESAPGEGEDGSDPPNPPKSPRTRPSLKRVK